jgi:hypothetical protein
MGIDSEDSRGSATVPIRVGWFKQLPTLLSACAAAGNSSPTTNTHGDCGTPITVPTCKAVSSRVGGSIADCGGELTGPVATNNL